MVKKHARVRQAGHTDTLVNRVDVISNPIAVEIHRHATARTSSDNDIGRGRHTVLSHEKVHHGRDDAPASQVDRPFVWVLRRHRGRDGLLQVTCEAGAIVDWDEGLVPVMKQRVLRGVS